MLKVQGVSCEIDSRLIVRNIDLHVPEGKWVGVIGPNGCGKTTLLKNIYKVLSPKSGSIYISGQNILGLKNQALSQLLSVVVQEHQIEFDFTVREIIEMGRFTQVGRLGRLTEKDHRMVSQSIEKLSLADIEYRDFLTLSGGEKQRVLIALALCQEPSLIVLDEPTNHLDIKHQLKIMDILKKLDLTVLTTIHDMNLAANYCDYLYAMKDGVVVKEGTVSEVFSEIFFREIFEVEAHVFTNPKNNKINVSFFS